MDDYDDDDIFLRDALSTEHSVRIASRWQFAVKWLIEPWLHQTSLHCQLANLCAYLLSK